MPALQNHINMTEHIVAAILEERQKQKRKFSNKPPADHSAFTRILGEEFGEVCKAVNQRKERKEIVEEVIQTMAVCWAWLEGDLRDGDQA
jgi:NTP pyrophosphatase (non-canonical NTP hydrolase)